MMKWHVTIERDPELADASTFASAFPVDAISDKLDDALQVARMTLGMRGVVVTIKSVPDD